MNEIIAAILFLYPGGLIDIFLNANKSNTYSTAKLDGVSRTALCFAYSIVATLLALLIFGLFSIHRFDLSATLALLDTWSGLIGYAITSLIALIPATAIIWWAHNGGQLAYSKYMSKKNGGRYSPERTVWQNLCNQDMRYVVRVINSQHEIVTQGYIKSLPDDLKEDPGLLLEYPDFAGHIFNDEERKENYFPQPEFVYFDSSSGYLYEFYNSDKYRNPETTTP